MQNRFESLTDKMTWRRGRLHIRKRDKVLARVIDGIEYPEFKVERDHYEALIDSIISQQISWAAARSILARFKGLYSGRLPKPAEYLKTKDARLRSAGLSPQKMSYIRDLCERIEDGSLELRRFRYMPDERIIEELDAVKGIGRWTAEMFMIFSLGRTDIFPVDDLGIKKAVQRVYGLRSMPDRKAYDAISRPWHPYSSIATLYLWRSADMENAFLGKEG